MEGRKRDRGKEIHEGNIAEAKFSEKIQTIVLTVILLAIHSHLYSFALRFVFLQLTQPLKVSTFYSPAIVYC